VLQREIDDTSALVADPERWQAPTACERWEARDVIGHLVDTTEGYLPNFELTRSGTESSATPQGLAAMAELVDSGARALRKVPREELIDRLHDPATLVLAGYGRMNGGTVRGDAAVAETFRTMIVPI
jgi:Mycothiol maleylpyruvate isomerase N-terminal domain